MWPSRWFTPISGTPRARATAFAAAIPTSSAPTSPGPTVTATPSIDPNDAPASLKASSISGFMLSRCARDATSGTTPPNRSWRWAWLESGFALIFRPSSRMATAVSSHEVSSPRLRTARPRCRRLGGADPERDLLDDPIQLGAIVARPDPVRPHHDGVLPRLLVIVLPDPYRTEPEPAVQPLGSPVR